jgi:transcriptional regulator with XRE-family HTH domain
VADVLAEHRVEVCEEGEAVRRLAERPDQVADGVPVQRARSVCETPFEPEAPPLLGAGRRRDLRERDGVPLDICTNIRDDSCSFIGMSAVVNMIGSNLRRLRAERRLSLAELAARSRVAKATLANLEQGRGNPTIETLWALALGLDVAFSDLLEQSEEPELELVRAHEGVHVVSGPLDLRLLDRLHRGGLTEVFAFTLDGRHDGLSHGPGIVECVLVTSGRMRAGPAHDPVELGPGDFVRYPADRAHVYEAQAERCTGILLVDYP